MDVLEKFVKNTMEKSQEVWKPLPVFQEWDVRLPNVIRGNIFHEPSVVVDTHVKRISRRLGLTKEEEPEKIEMELMKVLPKDSLDFV